MIKTYIYVLQERTGEVRYVGMTSKSIEERFGNHLAYARQGLDSYVYRWIRKCIKNKCIPLVRIIDGPIVGNGELEERYWISRYRRQGLRLTNSTDGGEGIPGHVMSEETKKKISDAKKGRPSPKKGKPAKKHTEESRIKMSISRTGKKRDQEIYNEEWRLKQSILQKGKHHRSHGPMSETTKQKLRDLRLGTKASDETRRKMSLIRTGRKRNTKKTDTKEVLYGTCSS